MPCRLCQLNIGRDKGSFYHEKFLRGMPQLACTIFRTKGKGDTGRPRASGSEPNFYSMPAMPAKLRDDQNGFKRALALSKASANPQDAPKIRTPSPPESALTFEDVLGEIPLMPPASMGDPAVSAVDGLTRLVQAGPLKITTTAPQENGHPLSGINYFEPMTSLFHASSSGIAAKASQQTEALHAHEPQPQNKISPPSPRVSPFMDLPLEMDSTPFQLGAAAAIRPQQNLQQYCPWETRSVDSLVTSMIMSQPQPRNESSKAKQAQTQKTVLDCNTFAQAIEPQTVPLLQHRPADCFTKELITTLSGSSGPRGEEQEKQCLSAPFRVVPRHTIATSAAEETGECYCLERMLLRVMDNAELDHVQYF
jgi:hypothetical protein